MSNETAKWAKLERALVECSYIDKDGVRVYQPMVLHPINPKTKFATLTQSDGLSVIEHEVNAMDSLRQIVCRVQGGDMTAIKALAKIVRETVGLLEKLASDQPAAFKSVAEIQPDWPVLLSLNPADKKRVTQLLEKM